MYKERKKKLSYQYKWCHMSLDYLNVGQSFPGVCTLNIKLLTCMRPNISLNVVSFIYMSEFYSTLNVISLLLQQNLIHLSSLFNKEAKKFDNL